jgi:hypothetical protein
VKYETIEFAGRIVVCCRGVALSDAPRSGGNVCAGQAGISIPNKFSNVEGVDSSAGLSTSDLSLQNSLMYESSSVLFRLGKMVGGRDRSLQFNPASQAANYYCYGITRLCVCCSSVVRWIAVLFVDWDRPICSCSHLSADQHRGSSPNGSV